MCCINFYAHDTPLSAQIAGWHVHKDFCSKTAIPGFSATLKALTPRRRRCKFPAIGQLPGF